MSSIKYKNTQVLGSKDGQVDSYGTYVSEDVAKEAEQVLKKSGFDTMLVTPKERRSREDYQ